MIIVLAGYRSWALEAFERIKVLYDNDITFLTVKSQNDLLQVLNKERVDLTFLAGWSWIIPTQVCCSNTMIAYHPSDLPAFAGGSPIQHQILAGIKHTQATLFRVTPRLDKGEILFKMPISFEGHICDIFSELTRTAVDLFSKTIRSYPNFPLHPQNVSETKKRLKPEQSHLTQDVFSRLSAAELYDFIRCREDPYPNVYIQDDSGTLYIKLVEFEPRKADDNKT